MKLIHDTDRILITENWKKISPKGMQMVERFYYLLFEKYPKMQALFVHSPYRQNVKFKDMMDLMIHGLEDTDQLVHILQESGQRHVAYGVQPDLYEPAGRILIQAIAEASGSAWSEELQEAWERLLEKVIEVMSSEH
ncbi:MAG: globin domain-containing protein [Bacteroidota bacterium]|nr:globin domain-containing protein [Bacteroidota bacterium]MDX5430612.1 globin domain-containing protein [Bacteroidota bacterium]MDX5469364.1 globin domain-containing protein [Bacteroidota bacterium]